jgi:hypothetical protein
MTPIAVAQPLKLEMSEHERFFQYFQTEVASACPVLVVQQLARDPITDCWILMLSAAGANASYSRSRMALLVVNKQMPSIRRTAIPCTRCLFGRN